MLAVRAAPGPAAWGPHRQTGALSPASGFPEPALGKPLTLSGPRVPTLQRAGTHQRRRPPPGPPPWEPGVPCAVRRWVGRQRRLPRGPLGAEPREGRPRTHSLASGVWWAFSPLLLLLLSRFSGVRLLATPWTAAPQAPPSMGFSRQEHWSGCHRLLRECFSRFCSW